MWGFESSIPSQMAHSSSGPGHRPLKAEIAGSNPACATRHHQIETASVGRLDSLRLAVLLADTPDGARTPSFSDHPNWNSWQMLPSGSRNVANIRPSC